MGALIYFLLFDFLTAKLGIPNQTIVFQTSANLIYGICGVLIFLTETQRKSIFRTLVIMNFAYAFVCLVLSFQIFNSSGLAGAMLILVEALFIMALARYEWKILQSNPNNDSWINQV